MYNLINNDDDIKSCRFFIFCVFASNGEEAKSSAKNWVINRLLGDEARYQEEHKKLQDTFRGRQQKCSDISNEYNHSFTCGQNPQLCREPDTIKEICGPEDKTFNISRIRRLNALQSAQQNIVALSERLAVKLNMQPKEILKNSVSHQNNNTCGSAWHYANLYCKFPIRAFSGKVGNALNVIGKVAFTGQAIAG